MERDSATQEVPEKLRSIGSIPAADYILPRAIGDEVLKALAVAAGVIILLLRQAWQL
jgi:hypothetical protein